MLAAARAVTDSGPELTDWLQAAGGAGGFLAAVVLAFLAYRQMRATNEQADAARDQARTMREAARTEADATRKESARRAKDEALQAARTRDLIAAVAGQAVAVREAAERQWQPLVYCHQKGGPVYGPTTTDDYGNDENLGEEVMFTYYLSNEGLGPALNVDHGIELDGELHLFGSERGQEEGFKFRTCRAGEFLPPLESSATQPVPRLSIRVYVPNDVFWGGGEGRDVTPMPVYFCRYENLFGDRWETRNPPNPTRSPEIRRLESRA